MEKILSVDLMSFIHKSINCTINADTKKAQNCSPVHVKAI